MVCNALEASYGVFRVNGPALALMTATLITEFSVVTGRKSQSYLADAVTCEEGLLMVASNLLQTTPQPLIYRVNCGGRQITMSYQDVFRAGYRLLLAGNYAEAIRVFGLLSDATDRGPRARILLAFCQSQLREYTACSQTLNQAFEAESTNLESRLHAAFVYWACGLRMDARNELEQVIEEHPNLPTVSLLLGDLLAQSGNRKAPPRLWQLAAQNDRPDGAVGLIARRELKEWAIRQSKNASK